MLELLEAHLFYASIVAIAAWLLTSAPRGSASAKYWIWTATSLNFLLPLSFVPARFWPSPVGWFTSSATAALFDRATISRSLIETLAIVWIAGSVAMLARLAVNVRRTRIHESPAVEGFLRPRIVFPRGVDGLLDHHEADAVLLHETIHARRRDNLIGLLHEIALCLLWFHPLVWLTGSRLALYRELSCDEAVVGREHGPHLLSALAKLACPEETSPLRANVTSFTTLRVARLTAPPNGTRAASVLIAIAFAAIFATAVVAPVARAKAADSCARTHHNEVIR